MNIKPLDDRILVKHEEGEAQTASGLYLPDSAREKPQTALVVAVGPGKLNEDGERTAVSVKVGDRVVLAQYAGTDVEISGEKHTIIRDGDLLAVVE